ncbi:MAG TPA: IS66 family transposase [Oligoflexus sp.]|uniref:IS66 family transposase n=1 Tax=Oligoflexus sp. TaxID=1971216 RepID=UPI002D407967|nr:IS66 family transposase [Oligoflexus sp.]HYX35164.1 IS66 family transposase [Oligoflexus sp.]
MDIDISRISFKNEKDIDYLRYAGDHLLTRVIDLERRLALALLEKKIDEDLLSVLTEDLHLLKKRFFAEKSEKRARAKDKPSSRRNKDRLLHNHRPINGDLSQVECELACEEVFYNNLSGTSEDEDGNSICSCGEGLLMPMTGAFEESGEIDVTDRVYTMKRHKRQKCKCTTCGKIMTAKGPDKLTAGSRFSVAMAVQVADDKFHHHLPLNRQSEMMAARGLAVGTRTLYALTEHLMKLLEEIPAMIRSEIHSGRHIHIDESPMDILNPKTKGYVWSISNPMGAYYQYETTRSGKVAREMLSGYGGVIMADAYSGYEFLEREEKITLALCLSHVRRKFHDARESYPKAEEMLDLIDELYEVEHTASNFIELQKVRAEKSTPVIERMQQWMRGQSGRYLVNSTIGKAISYATDNWDRLVRFLDNPYIPIDNNAGERSQRRPVMGRNNFLGFRTINGADTAMFFYTIIASCKLLGISPKGYMATMATRALKGEQLISPYKFGLEIENAIKERLALEMPQSLLNN